MKITRKLERKLRVLWEEAGIANDFIFGKIMQNPEFCRPMLERILHIKIARLEYTERQKDIKITGDSKGRATAFTFRKLPYAVRWDLKRPYSAFS